MRGWTGSHARSATAWPEGDANGPGLFLGRILGPMRPAGAGHPTLQDSLRHSGAVVAEGHRPVQGGKFFFSKGGAVVLARLGHSDALNTSHTVSGLAWIPTLLCFPLPTWWSCRGGSGTFWQGPNRARGHHGRIGGPTRGSTVVKWDLGMWKTASACARTALRRLCTRGGACLDLG